MSLLEGAQGSNSQEIIASEKESCPPSELCDLSSNQPLSFHKTPAAFPSSVVIPRPALRNPPTSSTSFSHHHSSQLVMMSSTNDLLDDPAEVSGSATGKKVKIIEPSVADNESEDEESQAVSTQSVGLEPSDTGVRPGVPVADATTVQSAVPPNTTATAATDTALGQKKIREERKKEREKKKEEEMLKKFKAEQEAKQKAAAKSKCGRWIKHNIKIGEGGYKFVYRGYDCIEARNVAWCEFKPEHVDTKEKRQAMFRETEIMLKMNHPHIVRCFDVFREWTNEELPESPLEERGLVIIQELMAEGTLKSVIRKNFLDGQCILKFPLITRWWRQILDALRYMHHHLESPIIHRDLKSENCFLYGASDEEYLNVKVGDFGLATHVGHSGRKTMLGTVGFMAPEIFDEKYDEKVDIYAFGMLMLEVMTNRTPYDECDTMLQVAAKTMSGHGPDIMQKISNPSLHMVISACIHPLACFRPTAEELFPLPLFQQKTLSVEVEPNYEKISDRTEVIERFVRSLANPETRNPKFNLRLRFRDRKMLQELGLDEGESLEFDLDIYKAEDQDIPDLIQSLRREYEDKLSRVYVNPKQPDKKIVTNHLDKLFTSIRLQMQFLVKCLLGKRWKDILDSLVSETKRSKDKPQQVQESSGGSVTGSAAVGAFADSDDEPDTDDGDCSNFAIIGKCKTKWLKAKKLLDREIQSYRKAASLNASAAGTSGNCESSQNPFQPQSSLFIAPPQPSGPTGTSSPSVVNVAEGLPVQTPPLPSVGGTAEVVKVGTEDVLTRTEGSPAPTECLPVVSQQDLPNRQPSIPAASTQMYTPLAAVNLPTQPQHISQPAPLRHPALPVAGQPHPLHYALSVSQQPGSLGTPFVANQVFQPGTPLVSYDVQTSLGMTGVHPVMLQSVQPSQPAVYPALPVVTSSKSAVLVDHQPSSVTAGTAYFAQQPTNYATAKLPSNTNLQSQQRLGEEVLFDQDTTSDTEAAGQAVGTGSTLTENLPVTLAGGGVVAGCPTLPSQHPTSQPICTTASSLPPVTKAAEQQRVVASSGTKPKRKISHQQTTDEQQPPRYIIRITRLERESEGCDVPGTLRPTFYVEMPDANNPTSELWKLSFRCNLYDTSDDIKLFDGCGYTQTNEEIDRAIKEAVATMLRALQADQKSIPLNHDYVFYPQLSPELVSLSACGGAQIKKEATVDEAGVFPSNITMECFTDFESPNDEDLNDSTPSADSPIEMGTSSRFARAPVVPTPQQYPFVSNVLPQSQEGPTSLTCNATLEEVSPLITAGFTEPSVYQSKSNPSFPQPVDASVCYASEPGATYDSTESLPVHTNSYTHHMLTAKEPEVFITLKVPAHSQSLISQFASYLSTNRRTNPMLVVPSDPSSPGHISVLPDHSSFLCSRGGICGGFSVLPLPASHSLLVIQENSAMGPQTRVFRPPDTGAIVIMADEEVHYVQRPTVLLPRNPHHPLVEVPLSAADGSAMSFDDILALMVTLRESLSDAPAPITLPKHHSFTENVSTTAQQAQSQHPQIRQQDTNYYSLPYGAVPLNYARGTVPAPQLPVVAGVARQPIFRAAPPPPQQIPVRPPSGSVASASHGDFSAVTAPLATLAPPTSPSGCIPSKPHMSPQRPSQQQLLSAALAASGLKQDQVPNQSQLSLVYLAALLSANPSLLLSAMSAPATTMSPSTSDASAPASAISSFPTTTAPATLPNAPSLWPNSSTTSLQASAPSVIPSSVPASNVTALTQFLLQAALEGLQQQQQLPSTPIAAPVATSGLLPGVFTSPVEEHDAKAVFFPASQSAQPSLPQTSKPPLPTVAQTQPAVGPAFCHPQMPLQPEKFLLPIPSSSSIDANVAAVPTSASTRKATIPVASVPQIHPPQPPPVTAVPPSMNRPPPVLDASNLRPVSKFIVTPVVPVPPLPAPALREGGPSVPSSSGPPPPPLPSPTPQAPAVIGNRFTVVSVESSGCQQSSVEPTSSHPQAPSSSVTLQQTAPPDSNIQKKIPSKFTVKPAPEAK
uniref:Protein kinase domain-containing protein n=1 Tax=Mesocestoides corti TaxID=53468 RepID=A0A5K3EQU0_MESCO